MIEFDIPVPIYKTYIRVHIMDSSNDLSELNELYTGLGYAEREGMTVELSDNRVVILILEKNYKKHVLTHECIHCAYCILERVGITISYNNQEPLTYLAEYIFKSVEEKTKEYTKQKKLTGNQTGKPGTG